MPDEKIRINEVLKKHELPEDMCRRHIVFSGYKHAESHEAVKVEVCARCNLVISSGDDELILRGESCQFVWDKVGHVWKFSSQPFGCAEIRAWGKIISVY